MQTNHADVIVHLPEALADRIREQLERALEAERGIARARTNPRAGQLLIVNYDPQVISAIGVLRTVQEKGFSARLVGM